MIPLEPRGALPCVFWRAPLVMHWRLVLKEELACEASEVLRDVALSASLKTGSF
jgi:hypothetical protein